MAKFNIGNVLKTVVDVGSNILPVPGGKLIGDVLENVIDEIADGPDASDGKEKNPGNRQGRQGRHGNRRMNRRRQAK
jgi:hypothetical protein